MFIEELLIDQLLLATPYTYIQVAEEKDMDLAKIRYEDLPRIYVGHIGTELLDSNDLASNGYNELGVPELLVTQIQFVCKRVDLPEVYYNIKRALQDWSPYRDNATFGVMNFHHGECIIRTGDKARWALYYRTEFPRLVLT